MYTVNIKNVCQITIMIIKHKYTDYKYVYSLMKRNVKNAV